MPLESVFWSVELSRLQVYHPVKLGTCMRASLEVYVPVYAQVYLEAYSAVHLRTFLMVYLGVH